MLLAYSYTFAFEGLHYIIFIKEYYRTMINLLRLRLNFRIALEICNYKLISKLSALLLSQVYFKACMNALKLIIVKRVVLSFTQTLQFKKNKCSNNPVPYGFSIG